MKFLFISEMLPIDTYASEVVFYRHFKRLADEGHEIHILTDKNSYARRKKELDPAFNIHILPNRLWHFPPYKAFGLLQRLRFFYYYHFIVKQLIHERKIDKLIGFVYGTFLAPFCGYVQERSKLPLFSFLHDDPVELHFNALPKLVRDNTINILSKSETIFVASEAFKDNWLEFSDKFMLLYPIPESTSLISSAKGRAIGYSGSVYNEIIASLERAGEILQAAETKLIIIGNNEKARYIANKFANVTYQSLFETSKESNEFLLENCAACIIPYPEQIADMPWTKTCFPSKLIQNTLLGIPTLVIAPTESALGKWCVTNNWLLYSHEYHESKIIDLINTINSAAVKAQVNQFATGQFNASKIHKQFKNLLLR